MIMRYHWTFRVVNFEGAAASSCPIGYTIIFWTVICFVHLPLLYILTS